MNIRPEKSIVRMRNDWDSREEKNAYYYIASENENWSFEEFLDSGERDVARLVDTCFQQIGLEPKGKKMLEIGCGVGRMTFALAKRFGEVYATDISPQMINHAQRLQKKLGVTNTVFQTGSGTDLAEYPSNSFDFVFSYIVFQHINDIGILREYVSEIGRVLKHETGHFQMQFNGWPHFRLPGSLYLMWGIRDTGRLRRWGLKKRPFVFLGRLNTWDGVPVRASEVNGICRDAGLDCFEINGIGSQYMWFMGRRLSGERED